MLHNTRLKEYFPMIRAREEVVEEIHENRKLQEIYNHWSEAEQKEFLDFCTGVKGVKIAYDPFFKEIFNPEYAPERLSDFLSELLGQRVKVLQVLPNDSTRIADEVTLLITDVVAELENGSIINVEIQKIGYMFPGQRASCHSADLLLRQYKRLRDRRKNQFSYREIKPVYAVVLFENSPAQFHKFEEEYIHHFYTTSDTGLELDLLQEFYFVSLDIFKKSLHNKGVTKKLEAWLTFLCVDEPDLIVELITSYPEFKPLYENVYQICRNMERVMGIFSEELRILDRNTIHYMIDTMQEEIDAKTVTISEQQGKLDELREKIDELTETIQQLQEQLAKQKQ